MMRGVPREYAREDGLWRGELPVLEAPWGTGLDSTRGPVGSDLAYVLTADLT